MIGALIVGVSIPYLKERIYTKSEYNGLLLVYFLFVECWSYKNLIECLIYLE